MVGPLQANLITGSGTVGDVAVNWQASHNIVTTLAIDDPFYSLIHSTPLADYTGVAALIVNKMDGGAGICTGSLLSGGMYMLTAAHCLTDSAGQINSTSVEPIFLMSDGSLYSTVTTNMLVHPGYSGLVFDEHDIALIRLDEMAPESIDRYRLHYDDALGEVFEVVGFGRRGQGDTGDTLGAGTRRRGYNEFDALGVSLLPFLGVTTGDSLLMFDFDNGLAANDAFGFWLGIDGLGLGDIEASTAPGDSGGPSFVNGRIAAVTSFGLTFSFVDDEGTLVTSDILPGLNSSFGEFAGSTNISYNRAWLDSILIPEPGTWLLVLFGLAGTMAGIVRRSRAHPE